MADKDPVKGRKILGAARTEMRRDLLAKYKAGPSIRALAAETGRSYGFVHTLLTEADVVMRPRGGGNRGPKAARRSVTAARTANHLARHPRTGS